MHILRYLASALALIVLAPGVAWADMPPWLGCGGCGGGGVRGWVIVLWLLFIAVMAYRWRRGNRR